MLRGAHELRGCPGCDGGCEVLLELEDPVVRHLYATGQVTRGMWHVTRGKWHVTRGKWQVDCGMWRVAGGKEAKGGAPSPGERRVLTLTELPYPCSSGHNADVPRQGLRLHFAGDAGVQPRGVERVPLVLLVLEETSKQKRGRRKKKQKNTDCCH